MEDGNGGMRSANAIVSLADANTELVPVAENNGLLAPMLLMPKAQIYCAFVEPEADSEGLCHLFRNLDLQIQYMVDKSAISEVVSRWRR